MSELARMQAAFARDLRTSGHEQFSDAPGMSIYRELFFNNICGFIDGAFPVCADVVGEEGWRSLCRDFFSSYSCDTPLFLKISEEFLAYLQARPELYQDFPYLAELAHYEWLELAVDVMEDVDTPEIDGGDVVNGIPVVTPALMTACYHYPVHRISVETSVTAGGGVGGIAEEISGFIVYRNSDDLVKFVACNPMTLAIMEHLLAGEQLTGKDAVLAVLSMMGLADNDVAINGGIEILNTWFSQGILLGAAKH
ncbi:MAG: putative DNA-binding domain-containing protein [Alcanivorax sp.]|jgi:hypothetical protein